MSDDNRTPSSADPASKRKQSRKKPTPEQELARLEQRIAQIILGDAFTRFVDSLASDRQQKAVQSLWALVSERDQKALIDSGLLPEQAIPVDYTDGVKIHQSGSDAKKSGDCA